MLKKIVSIGTVLNKSDQKAISGGRKLNVVFNGGSCDTGTTCSVDSECPEGCKCDFDGHGYKICG
jgi:hypothetical protein